MTGAAHTSLTGNGDNYVSSSQTINLIAEKEVVDMKQTDLTTTKHSARTTIRLSIASLLVPAVLIPKEYSANTLRLIHCYLLATSY